jgi:hypothetical protein
MELLAGGTLSGQGGNAVRRVSSYFTLSGHSTSLGLQLATSNFSFSP